MINDIFTIDGYTQNFRIKKMNAIEFFSLRTQIDFSDFNSSVNTTNLILERIEVQLDDDTWLSVKSEKDYYPAGIEDDVLAINNLSSIFLKEFRQVFTKSNKSDAKPKE